MAIVNRATGISPLGKSLETSFGWSVMMRRGLLAILAGVLIPGLLSVSAMAQFDQGGGEPQQILTGQAYASLSQAKAGDTVWLAVLIDLEPEWHINSAHPLQDFLIPTKLELKVPNTLKVGPVTYPEGRTIPLLGDRMSVYASGATIFVPVYVDPSAPPGNIEATGTLRYQGCNDRLCLGAVDLPLRWNLTVAAQRGEIQNPDIFASVLGRPATTSGTTPVTPAQFEQQSDLQRLITKYGAWGYVLAFLLAFGTGFLLSFSPCTYPMIPITVSIFAGQARGVGRGFVLSLFYVLTMAVVYGIMGMIVATAGGVFGAWLAHPVVVSIIVAIFVVFALSMFGLYELQVPLALRNKMAGRGGSGIGGAIVLGAVAALVVSPCVGPFVAGIMLYVATTGSALLGFFVLFTFALGLGTLFILIGTFSSAIQNLPHAGEWMETVKKFFGFVLLLMALYFLRTLISTELLALLAGLLLLALGVLGGGLDRLTQESPFFARLRKLVGIIAFILGIYLLGGYLLTSGFVWPPVEVNTFIPGSSGSEPSERIPWLTDLDNGLSQAKAESKPVVIDTWATWCANCRKLDKATWADDRVAAEVQRFLPLKLQLEKSDSPETKHFLNVFQLKQYSLPTIILINSQGQVGDVIQGFLGPEDMLKRLQAVS
ncbi:MAG: thioredoxin family protein [candidate division Zixibacteria bacterium]|nr:thioredoxin family protein [candidate division Zixibacteria bacterium]